MNKNKQYITITHIFNRVYPIGVYTAILMIVMFSCQDETGTGNEGGEQENEQPFSIVFDTRAFSPGMINNINLYIFDNHSSTSHLFIGKMENVTKSGDTLTTSLPAGVYQLGIVSCESEDIMVNSQFKIPVIASDDMQTSPMWVTETYVQSGKTFLNQIPELLYVTVRDIPIISNITTTIGTDKAALMRNVAKIQFVLMDHEGFDPISEGENANAFIDLLNVPTQLTWEGKYRDKDKPVVAKDASNNLIPMRENLVFKNDAGKMVADTVEFIIPAHREDNAQEVSGHKLKFQISMPVNGNLCYGESVIPVEINSNIRANQITRVIIRNFNASDSTEWDLTMTVKGWNDVVDQTEVFD